MTATIHRFTSRADSPVRPLDEVLADIRQPQPEFGDMAEFLAVKRIIPIRRKPDLSLCVPLACGLAVIGWGVVFYMLGQWGWML